MRPALLAACLCLAGCSVNPTEQALDTAPNFETRDAKAVQHMQANPPRDGGAQ